MALTAHPLETISIPAGAESATGEGVVRAHDVTKRFGTGASAVEALRGIDVGFDGGTFTAIMGPSGSGKSTLCTSLPGSTGRPRAGSRSRASASTASMTAS